MSPSKKIFLKILFIDILFLFLISCKTQQVKTATWITNPIINTEKTPSLTYMQTKIKALEATGFKNFSPFILAIDRTMQNILFVFYSKDIDSIARVQVNTITGNALVIEIKDQVSKKGFDFLQNIDLIIDAEQALNIATKREARIQSPTEYISEYTYSSKFKRFTETTKAKDETQEDKVDPIDAFNVVFGTKKFEYVFNIKANIGDNVVLGSPRINSRADDRVIN